MKNKDDIESFSIKELVKIIYLKDHKIKRLLDFIRFKNLDKEWFEFMEKSPSVNSKE